MFMHMYAIMEKIFETDSSFHLKQPTKEKVQFLFFRRFFIVLTKFSIGEGD